MHIISDFHSHVSQSSAAQMVQAARDKGLKTLGLSEHDFQMNEIRPILEHLPLEGALMPLADYAAAVQSAAKQFQMDVRLGMEVDFIPTQNGAIHALIREQQWDFLIGSIHEVDGVMFENDGISWGPEEGQACWLRYM